jgi:poly(A) polymerase
VAPLRTHRKEQDLPITDPIRISREQHPISRKDIAPGTLKVLYTLKDAGYEAYLVGGGVRDLLAGLQPKDFDVATSAHPEEIRKAFRSCRLVGRRFLIAHVRMGDEIVEVATFRGPITDSHERDETGRILSDNVYGSLETDAFRRDFSINALYYDIRDFSIVDFAGGVEDLRNGLLRLIGDPELRYREDPVRMLRAIRIANKLRFTLPAETAEPIPRLAALLGEIPPARLFDEIVKLLMTAQAVDNFEGLRRYRLFGILFPDTETALIEDPNAATVIRQALENTAERIARDAPVTPAFLYAALLWPAVALRAANLRSQEGHPPMVALAQAADETLARQGLRVVIPKRFSVPMREIWLMQPRFEDRRGGRAKRLLAHPRFRAAYDFLLLRSQAGETGAEELADWWTHAQSGVFQALPAAPPAGDAAAPAKKKRRRRRGGRGRGKGGNDAPQAGDA